MTKKVYLMAFSFRARFISIFCGYAFFSFYPFHSPVCDHSPVIFAVAPGAQGDDENTIIFQTWISRFRGSYFFLLGKKVKGPVARNVTKFFQTRVPGKSRTHRTGDKLAMPFNAVRFF